MDNEGSYTTNLEPLSAAQLLQLRDTLEVFERFDAVRSQDVAPAATTADGNNAIRRQQRDSHSTPIQRRQVRAVLAEFREETLALQFNGVHGIEFGMQRALALCQQLDDIGVVAKAGSCFEDCFDKRMLAADYSSEFYGDPENGAMVWGGFVTDLDGARFEEAVIQAGVKEGVFVDVRLHETKADGKSASFGRKPTGRAASTSA